MKMNMGDEALAAIAVALIEGYEQVVHTTSVQFADDLVEQLTMEGKLWKSIAHFAEKKVEEKIRDASEATISKKRAKGGLQ